MNDMSKTLIAIIVMSAFVVGLMFVCRGPQVTNAPEFYNDDDDDSGYVYRRNVLKLYK